MVTEGQSMNPEEISIEPIEMVEENVPTSTKFSNISVQTE